MKKINILILALCCSLSCFAQYAAYENTQRDKEAVLSRHPQLKPVINQWYTLLNENDNDPYVALQEFTGEPLPFYTERSTPFINSIFASAENPTALAVDILVTDNQTSSARLNRVYALPGQGYIQNSSAHAIGGEYPLWKRDHQPFLRYYSSLITRDRENDVPPCTSLLPAEEEQEPASPTSWRQRIRNKIDFQTLKSSFKSYLKNVDPLVENFALEPLPGEKPEKQGRNIRGRVHAVYAEEKSPDNLWISAEICGSTRFLKVRRPTMEEIKQYNSLSKEEIEAMSQAPHRYRELSAKQWAKCANRTLLWSRER